MGKATIAIGAVNDHARRLAQTMGDPNGTLSASEPLNYVVGCTVDIAPSIEFRSVNYSRASNRSDLDLDNIAFTVDGSGEACTPKYDGDVISLSDIITNGTLAYGAAASYPLLVENSYRDGWWPTLYEVANGGYTSTERMLASYNGSFSNAANPLEDALGLMSAIVLSLYWAEDLDSDAPAVLIDEKVYKYGVRVGSGQMLALIYIVPELYAITLLLYLIVKKPEKKVEEAQINDRHLYYAVKRK